MSFQYREIVAAIKTENEDMAKSFVELFASVEWKWDKVAHIRDVFKLSF